MTAIGPSDTTAVDGGIIVKGTTDKKITWKGTDGGVTYNTWVSSENFDLASGKILTLNGVNIADPTAQTIGPVNGTGTDDVNLSGGGTAFTLGSAVLNSSLTSVGTLDGLTISRSTAAATALKVTGNYTGGNSVDIQTWERSGGAVQAKLIYRDSTTGMVFGTDTSHVLNIMTGGVVRARFLSTGAFEPFADATYDLGGAGNRWSNVYAQNYRFNANGNITYNTVANTMEFEVGGGQVAEFTSSGAFVPNADNTRDLGGTTRRWANIYSADLQLSNEGAANEVDGTWGQYTIQEGEDDLFLINRRSGKKYKFMLQEVQ